MRSRETREEVFKHIKLLDFQLECLESSKNRSFYSTFGRNRPIVLIDGYDGTVHRGPFQTCRGRPISTNGLYDPRDERYKNALICRRWIVIRRSRCSPQYAIVAVITLLKRHVRFDHDRWSAHHVIDAQISTAPTIRRVARGHVTCVKNTVWDFSPTREKLKEIKVFIRRDGFRGLNTLPIYGRLNLMHYIVYKIYM